MTLVHFQSTYGGISANAAQENVSGPSFCPENTYGNIRKIPVQNVFRPSFCPQNTYGDARKNPTQEYTMPSFCPQNTYGDIRANPKPEYFSIPTWRYRNAHVPTRNTFEQVLPKPDIKIFKGDPTDCWAFYNRFSCYTDRQKYFIFQAPRKQKKNKMNNKHSVKLLLLICIITYDKSIAQFNGGLKGDCEWTDWGLRVKQPPTD